MRLLDFPHTAYKITSTQHVLFDGDAASTLTLTGTKPAVSFRCQVRLYTATAKTDCTGSVVVGTETLTFTQASKKVTSVSLTALPVVTTSNLTCLVEIIAIDVAGMPIMDATETAIKVRWEPTTKSVQNASGAWIITSAFAMVVDSTILPGSVVKYLGVSYVVVTVEAFPWLDGTELYRILYFA
jgi:hypothetical protein